MKFILAISFVLFSLTTCLAQEVVFEKNYEIALFNESRGLSSIVESLLKTTGNSDNSWAELTAIMREKDGYVSILKTSQGIVVKHESWIPYKDIVDVLLAAGIQVIPVPMELIESTN